MESTVKQYFAASRNSDNKVESMVSCFAEDGVSHDPAEGSARQGHAELRQFFQGIARLFQTVELQEEFISITGNEAAVKWKGQGISQNGTIVTFEGIDLFQFNAAGKIQSMRAYWNPAALLAKL